MILAEPRGLENFMRVPGERKKERVAREGREKDFHRGELHCELGNLKKGSSI